jgi:hypothetical protein
LAAFRAEHITRSESLVVARPAAEAIRLFTPEGERAWAQGWDPQYRHPLDGRLERGMVFTTGHGDEHTIWTIIRCEPANGLMEYVRTTPGSRTGTVLVQCAPLDATRTRVTVVYSLTALSEEGNKALRELDEARFRAFIASWEQAIAAALERG